MFSRAVVCLVRTFERRPEPEAGDADRKVFPPRNENERPTAFNRKLRSRRSCCSCGPNFSQDYEVPGLGSGLEGDAPWPRYFLGHVAVLGGFQRGTTKGVLGKASLKLVAPASKPPPESCADVATSNALSRCANSAIIHADGAPAWRAAVKAVNRADKKRRLKVVNCNHSKSEFVKRHALKACKGASRMVGTQLADRRWHLLDSWIPLQSTRCIEQGSTSSFLSLRIHGFGATCMSGAGCRLPRRWQQSLATGGGRLEKESSPSRRSWGTADAKNASTASRCEGGPHQLD